MARGAAALIAVWLFAGTATGQFLGRDAREWLAELESRDASRRRAGAYGLGHAGATAHAVDALLRAVADDPSPAVREAAASALGEIASRVPHLTRGATPRLAKALADRDALVRRSAAAALGAVGGDAARLAVENALTDRRPEVRQAAAGALGRFGAAAAPALTRSLADDDALALRDAIRALSQLEPNAAHAATDALAPLVRHADVEVRRVAVETLTRVVGPADGTRRELVTALRHSLADSDDDVRSGAALALSNLGGDAAQAAADVLLAMVRRPGDERRGLATAALRNLGPRAEPAVDDLIALLADDDAELRSHAAAALGAIGRGAVRATPALVALVADRNAPTPARVEAAVALSLVGPSAEARDAVPTLLARLVDPREPGLLRVRILWALRVHEGGLRAMPEVAPAFAQVLDERTTDANRLVRFDCAYLAGVLYGPKAPPPTLVALREYLEYDKLKVYRSLAVSVEGSSVEGSVGKASARELGEGDGRTLAVDALTRIGPAVVRRHPALLAQLRLLADAADTTPDLRSACRELLRTLE